jgi:hypothetical protein
VKKVWNFIVFAIAILYFVMDAIFATIAIPLSKWIATHWVFERIHRWVLSLRPYPTLLLFILPLVILEPVKPAAAYLAATGHAILGLTILAIGEILKLIMVERLFSVSHNKLLSIPAFAWAYGKYSAAKTWFTSLEAWQLVLRWSRIARYAVHRYASQLRYSPKSRDAYLPLTPAVARRQRN